MQALAKLVQAGKVRAIGLSNETPWGVAEFVRAHYGQEAVDYLAEPLLAGADQAQDVVDLEIGFARTRAVAAGVDQLFGTMRSQVEALRAVAEGAIDPAALVLSAPMLGLRGGNMPDWLLHGLAKVLCRLGDPRRPAWKWSERPGQPPDSRGDLLTHDRDRYADELWWREQRPELVMGPGSWRWIERAYASMRGLARRSALTRVKLPVLLLATDQDALVSFRAIRHAAKLLPDCELVNFGDRARHEILREADPVRNEALDRIDAFLARTLA